MAHDYLPVYIEDEMKKSYLDYAMSVIIGRALPDVRDGLKPVHRRILFAMHEMGLEWSKPFKKSARVVGDVIGKYHPHGDAAAYDSLTRMVQDFSLRYPLVAGQGNFGSIDGDAAAAYRYTEAKLSKIAGELLKDIEKETVNFSANFDDSLMEPKVLPAAFPNLLVNGSSGIAVGMATNMAPHNLTETINAILHLIKNPDCTIATLMKIIPGPDFPTGAFICGRTAIKEAYTTGRGIIQLRARANTEQNPRTGRQSIIITEIPFMVNKGKLIENMANLVRNKKIEGISELRDESDREGMRIVIELKRDEIVDVVLNNLYSHTQMQTSFGIINLAIVNGRPKVLGLKELITNFVEFRKDVVTRRTVFELNKAKARAHILEGLKIAVDNLDKVIKLIRASKSPSEAKDALMKHFKLSGSQAQAILEMKLQRLTALEREKIATEYKELQKVIKGLEDILASTTLLMEVIVEELTEVRERYGDERRTEIIEKASELSLEDMIAEEDMVVNITQSGYIKRTPTSLFKIQKRGGKGKKGMTPKEEDVVTSLFVASTHSHILFFTDRGKTYSLKVYDIPQAGRTARGKAIVNILKLSQDENITACLPVKEFAEDNFIVMATEKGIIKKTDLMRFSNIRSGGIIAVNLDKGDHLIATRLTDGSKGIFIGTRNGLAIRFNENQVREMGRTARGVKAIKLSKEDRVVSMLALDGDNSILTVTQNGYGKRTGVNQYREQLRGGQGIINLKLTDKTGPVIGIDRVADLDEMMITTSDGKIIRIAMNDVSVIGRNTQGVRLMNVQEGVELTGIAKSAARNVGDEPVETDDPEG